MLTVYDVSMPKDMPRFRQLLLDYLDQRNLSLRELAEQSGVSAATLSNILTMRTKQPATDTCIRLAPFLGVSEDDLLELAGHKSAADTPPRVRSVAELAAELARRAQELERQVQELRSASELLIIEVPVTAEASASRGRTVSPDDVSYWGARKVDKLPGNQQALRVVGDCLDPQVRSGDIVLVDPDIPWRVGQTIAIRVDGGCQVKRLLKINGQLTLDSRHGQMVIDDEDARIAGVVIARQEALSF
jgi:transcriptional regulator with XRE-family HTH domain